MYLTDNSSSNTSHSQNLEMEENDYSIMKDNPQEQMSLLNKYVNIIVIKNNSFMGFIQSIDPLTGSIILSIPLEDSYKTMLIPGHVIISVGVTVPSSNIKLPSRRSDINISNEDLLSRKLRVKAWFQQNMLPVVEENETIVLGNVTVLPPYGCDNIRTDNTVVALQIRRIMENMPEDFKPAED